MSELKITYLPTGDLIPYARNSRTHTDEQVAQVAASIREFGFASPVLIGEDKTIIAGHCRVMAAQKLGLETVPTITATGWTEAQKRAYVIVDNRLAENAGWDTEMLKTEFADLDELGFDLSLLGFDEESFDELLGEMENPDTDGKYTTAASTPQYEPTGKHVTLDECCNTNRYEQMLELIESSNVPDAMKAFLRHAATRFIEFTYKNIAEYYANDADEETQELFEKMALVIIDYDDAVKNGFCRIQKRLAGIVGEDYEE